MVVFNNHLPVSPSPSAAGQDETDPNITVMVPCVPNQCHQGAGAGFYRLENTSNESQVHQT